MSTAGNYAILKRQKRVKRWGNCLEQTEFACSKYRADAGTGIENRAHWRLCFAAKSKGPKAFNCPRYACLRPDAEGALIAGITRPVLMCTAGVISTPAAAYLTKQLNGCGGVMISASHNPYHDNGISSLAQKALNCLMKWKQKLKHYTFRILIPRRAQQLTPSVVFIRTQPPASVTCSICCLLCPAALMVIR